MKTLCSSKRVSLAFSILIFFLPIVQGQTAQEIAKKTLPSVVVLVAETSKGKSVSLGSGFFVRDDVIATNYHVIKGSSRIYAKIVGQSSVYPIKKVLAFDSQKDLALLRISGVKASPIWIGNSCIMEVGDTVYVVGNPKGLEGTFSQGIVSGVRKIKGNRYLQVTAALSQGSSGGPILNEYGEVIGIAVASMRDGQNLNFAVSGQDLAAIIVKTVGEGFGVDILADIGKCSDEVP